MQRCHPVGIRGEVGFVPRRYDVPPVRVGSYCRVIYDLRGGASHIDESEDYIENIPDQLGITYSELPTRNAAVLLV